MLGFIYLYASLVQLFSLFKYDALYHQDESEMRQLMESLSKVNEAQAEGEGFFESHVIFDGGANRTKLTDFALVLISMLEETLGENALKLILSKMYTYNEVNIYSHIGKSTFTLILGNQHLHLYQEINIILLSGNQHLHLY